MSRKTYSPGWEAAVWGSLFLAVDLIVVIPQLRQPLSEDMHMMVSFHKSCLLVANRVWDFLWPNLLWSNLRETCPSTTSTPNFCPLTVLVRSAKCGVICCVVSKSGRKLLRSLGSPRTAREGSGTHIIITKAFLIDETAVAAWDKGILGLVRCFMK